MNQEFLSLYQLMCTDQITVSEFLSKIQELPNVENDLLTALKEKKAARDWSTVCVLIWAVQRTPHICYTNLLCSLLDERSDNDLFEAVLDALFEIGDERSISSIERILSYHIPGDDDLHFNKKCLQTLVKIGTSDAMCKIEKFLNEENCPDKIKDYARQILRITKLH